MSLRHPSRRVTKRTRGIAFGRLIGGFKSRLFAVALLPQALTLNVSTAPTMTVRDQLAATLQETTLDSQLTIDTTKPYPIVTEFTPTTIAVGPSRAEQDRLRAMKSRPTIASTPRSASVPEPDFEAKRVLAQHVAADHEIDWRLLEAVWQIESGKSWHTAVASSAGAQGPMQFMPGTWRRYGADGNGDGVADAHNAIDALHGGARYLAANGAASGDIDRALFAYNHAHWYVAKVKKIMNSI